MLILKHLPVASFSENIAYINRNCSAYKADDINALVKIEIHGGVRTIYAFLQIVDDDTVVAPNQLALNNEAFEQINLPEGAKVSISVSPTPPSINSIARKIAGNILTSGEYSAIVNDIVSKRYSNLDIASFLVASGSFMSAPEVLSLTEAMVGDKLIHWDNENIVVDCHCLGGVPGNKTDIIVTAIVAAYGLPMPKTASYSLTSCAGVADTFSVLAHVDVDEKELLRLVTENRGAIVSYNNLDICPASKLIAQVERQSASHSMSILLLLFLLLKWQQALPIYLLIFLLGQNHESKALMKLCGCVSLWNMSGICFQWKLMSLLQMEANLSGLVWVQHLKPEMLLRF